MRILVLSFGDERCASTKFRFCQFVDPLRREGVELQIRLAKGFTDFRILPEFDLVILQKRLANTLWLRKVRKWARILLFDTDDAIWEAHNHPHSWWTTWRTKRRLCQIASDADSCTVPNSYLAGYLRRISRRVELIPMALDPAVWLPSPERTPGPIRIGWAGAPQNLIYLTNIGGVLARIQKDYPALQLVVYCGAPPVWDVRVDSIHHCYEAGSEVSVVQTFDIGLLPLPVNSFAAGKSPIKALQYAACGVACVASPVGATNEIVQHGVTGLTAATLEEWDHVLRRLIDDVVLRRKLGNAARTMFLGTYALDVVVSSLLTCWRDLFEIYNRKR